uniref:tyrosine-protein phosphatase non-receptor type 23-like n=1 Tax=Myxine glutinosa TaxID=7769 RepID=UPI00358EEE9B
MEALPRLPMVSLELKEPGEFPFTDSVLKYIASHYGEDPEKYADEIRKLEQLRQQVENVTKDFEGCSVLRKYFGQLHFLQSRVPMEAGQSAAVAVTWLDTVSGKLVTHEDVKYEQAAVLYNLGALHSLLGAIDSRTTEEGMKVSCTHFQCAAGAFTFLLDHLGPGYSDDMAASTLSLHANLMLGQAQECLLEKSMLDHRKSFLIARISAQVSEYYSNACRSLESGDVALGRFQREWRKHLRFKTLFFSSIAQYYMGKQADEQQSKYGESVAHHHAALEKLNEAVKVAKGLPDAFQDALQFAMDVVGGRYNSAKKDNDFIYHDTVPPADSLPSIKGAPLVKALPFQPTDPNVTGPDIFARLVPIEAHEASSLYSEEKANLLRDVMDKIEKKEQELQQYLHSLDLDLGKLSNPPSYDRIPQTLMERCAALSARPDAIKSIVQAMTDLSGLVMDVEASMQDIENLLEEDENSERSYREVMGSRSESSAIKELSQEWGRYVEALQKANVTNLELRKAMESHVATLRLLTGPQDELKASLPMMTFTEEDEVARRAVQRMLGKVEEMSDQRTKLEKQLRDMIQQDDITETLVMESRNNHRVGILNLKVCAKAPKVYLVTICKWVTGP